MESSCRLRALALVVCASFALCAATTASSQTPQDSIEEQLGSVVPLDLRFVDESGKTVTLGSVVDRPTILSLVYYECPSVCRPLLEEVSTVLGKLQAMDLKPLEDYRVVTISFDPTDSPAGSARLKNEYYNTLPTGFPKNAWTFLTGDSTSINAFTAAVGFNYRRVGDMFAHPTTLIVLAADGKITRYLLGAEYLPVDLKMAVLEASEGRVGPTIAKFFQYCFSYDPEGRKYVLNLTRIIGTSTILGVLFFAIFLTASSKRRSKQVG